MIKKKKIVCLIPARGGSKGIKHKNLKKINNLSLVEIAIRHAKKIKYFDKIVVNSDHKKIIKISQKIGVDVIHREKKYSGDKVSDYQIISSSIKKLKENYDYVVYLQPTSPFRKNYQLIEALKIMIKKNYNSIWSVTKIDKKFHPFKVLKSKKGFLNLFHERGKKIVARQQLDDAFIRNGIFYIFNVKALKKYKTIYLPKTSFYETNYFFINIDNYNDLRKARKNYKKILL